MKELQLPIQDHVKNASANEIRLMKRYVSTIRRRAGETVWELELATGDVRPAKFKEAVIQLVPERWLFIPFVKTGRLVPRIVREIECDPTKCLYVSTVFKKTAIKRFAIIIKLLKGDAGEKEGA